jgi:hypothetical protein
MRAVRDARDLVAATHEVACARPAGSLTEPDLDGAEGAAAIAFDTFRSLPTT